MKRFLLPTILLSFALLAWPQTHTFPALDTNNGFTGANTFKSLNNLIWVDGMANTTIAQAYATVTAGQCVALPPGYTETLAANLTFGTNQTCLIAFGKATITMGAFQVIVSPGMNGFLMQGLGPFSPKDNNLPLGGIVLNGYTGTAECLKIGAAGSDTLNIDLRNVYCNLTSAGASAIGFGIYRTQRTYTEHIAAFLSGTVNNQIGILYDAKDGTQTHAVDMQHWVFTGAGTGTGQIGERWTGNSSNSGGDKTVIGGDTVTLNTAGTIGIDVLTGDTLQLLGPSIEGAQTGLNIASTQSTAVGPNSYIRFDSSVTPNIITFGAGTSNNTIWTQNSGTINDSGTSNFVTVAGTAGINSRFFTQCSNSTTYCIKDNTGNQDFLDINRNTGVINLGGTTAGNGDILTHALGGSGLVRFFSGGGSPAEKLRINGSTGTIQNPGGTVTMGLTLKKGSGAGNYTNATTSYTVADSSNLCFTVTIPTGWKLGISASGALSTATAAVVAQAALTDNAACSTANAGILVETAPIQGAAIAVADAFALNWVITGDGAAHNIALQFKTSNAADTASLINSSATVTPTMKFELMPSN